MDGGAGGHGEAAQEGEDGSYPGEAEQGEDGTCDKATEMETSTAMEAVSKRLRITHSLWRGL